MGFTDAYLLKAGLREALIEPEPHPGLKISVTIPVYHESGLERCLDSLFQCSCGAHPDSEPDGLPDGEPGSGYRAEVLILINAPWDAPVAILEQNRATLETTRSWIEAHPHPSIDFHVWLDHSFGKKEAGVGIARKILMDEAVRRFSALERPEGIIASMDADAVVQPNYLEALVSHFEGGRFDGHNDGDHFESVSLAGSGPDGCSIRFEHPLSESENDGPEKFPPEVYEAIAQYELHLHYYLQSVRSTGYPYAYHTVGSAFAVRSDIYCKEGGMNRRQGGEDFYFIQKVAQRGNFSQCNTTCVVPSPRPSDRVPFGTGPVISRLTSGEDPLMTYDPRPFGMLKSLFEEIERYGLLTGSVPLTGWVQLIRSMPQPLQAFLEQQQFKAAMAEIRNNSASAPAFRKRFWRWFNMFRIMKFLHFARERGYPDIPVEEAAQRFLSLEKLHSTKQLLEIFRDRD